MIQNVLLTGLTPLRNTNEVNCWQNQPFRTVWPENTKQKTKDITRTIKKKQKRVRTAFTTDQLRALERSYSCHKYIDIEKRAELAKALNIGDKCIKIWFQNRRMKEKKELSESGSDSSSESFGNETPAPASPPSPPLQIPHHQFPILKSDHNNSELYNSELYKSEFYKSELYQLPPQYSQVEYNTHAANNFASHFYNDANVYPTQYYPFDVNYSTHSEGQGFSQQCQYGEINNYWPTNQHPYYAAI